MKMGTLKRVFKVAMKEQYIDNQIGTKMVFYSIINAPFVFVKRFWPMSFVTILIWGSLIGTFILMPKVKNITDKDRIILLVCSGLFIQFLYIAGWCTIETNLIFWRYGKSVIADSKERNSRANKRKRIEDIKAIINEKC